MNHIFNLESILFVASKPLSLKKMMEALHLSEESVREGLDILKQKYAPETSGVVLIEYDDEWQLATHPENHVAAEQFLKTEISEELTRPQLETLTVISYCGPLTKAELEQIRGVNCSIILRNLMMRGLVEELEDSADILPRYRVTMEYIRALGITCIEDLPRYAELHRHEYIVHSLSGGPVRDAISA